MWTELLRAASCCQAAYALDSTMIELIFISGPLLTAAIAAVASPAAALIVSAVAVVTGTLVFTALAADARAPSRTPTRERQPARRARLARRAHARAHSLPAGHRRSGCSRSGIPAFSRAEGAAAAAGVLLAIWSLGSGLGGLLYGTLPRRRGARTARTCCVAALLPLALLPLALAPSVAVMALLVIPAGCCIAPLLATRNELVGGVAPPGRAHRGLHLADHRVRRRDRGRRGARRRARRGPGAGGPRSCVARAAFAAVGAVLAVAGAGRGTLCPRVGRPSDSVPLECMPIRSLSSLRRFASGSTRAFAEPTAAQAQAWPAIATGEHVLISAPTGSGKTLAAFLWALDRLVAEPTATTSSTRLVYVSPLKALSYDVEKNLRAPLRGIGADAQRRRSAPATRRRRSGATWSGTRPTS